MFSKKSIFGFALCVFLFAGSAHASDELSTDKTYQDGFDAGIAYAIAALAFKKRGMADTPYPVELPSYPDDWDKPVQMKIKIHACISQHMERELFKAGGGVNLLYNNITTIAERVLNYCGM